MSKDPLEQFRHDWLVDAGRLPLEYGVAAPCPRHDASPRLVAGGIRLGSPDPARLKLLWHASMHSTERKDMREQTFAYDQGYREKESGSILATG